MEKPSNFPRTPATEWHQTNWSFVPLSLFSHLIVVLHCFVHLEFYFIALGAKDPDSGHIFRWSTQVFVNSLGMLGFSLNFSLESTFGVAFLTFTCVWTVERLFHYDDCYFRFDFMAFWHTFISKLFSIPCFYRIFHFYSAPFTPFHICNAISPWQRTPPAIHFFLSMQPCMCVCAHKWASVRA